MQKNVFIFVVCGAKEHLDTLHFSLPYLKKKTSNEIWVLTDASRNEIPVQHDKIIDVKTPEEFDNHQASIFLKTGIYKFVPKGNKYCYLDTDIIAVNRKVDGIFDEYVAPITFAPDHCILPQFSAFAVNCGCEKRLKEDQRRFEEASLKYDRNRQITDKEILQSQKQLQDYFTALKSDKWRKYKTAFRFLFSFPIFRLNKEFSYDRRKKCWKNAKGEIILYDVKPQLIEKASGLKYNRYSQKWTNQYKENIWVYYCSHLQEAIEEKFGISISDSKFQHWNGGVFLFDDQSEAFLSAWFEKTMSIFKDKKWRTRDQGTLIATVWEFGLQNHPMLSKKWNLIADYYKPIMRWEGDRVQIDWDESYEPNFVHVYHHFGDESWEFWRELIKRANA